MGGDTIAQLFARQAARTPGAFALTSAHRRLTYEEAEDRVNRLARRLQEHGVGAETLVAVLLDRSPEMVISLLAVLQAGGAYVPLDTKHPAGRLAQILEDAAVSVVISSEALRNRLPGAGIRVISVDGEGDAIAQRSPRGFSCPALADSPAYVIYTSGSTGKPKGVMIEHRNVLSFFQAMDRLLGSDAGVWLAVTAISFDISVLELLWTLTRGFEVVLHSGEDSQAIAGEIERYGVTHFQSTPSLARILVRDPRALSALGSLKKLLLGGEAFPASLADTLLSVMTGELYNMYGPTEATIWSTAQRVVESTVNIPIGRPLDNTRAYVLDDRLQPARPGEPGELYLGGGGVGRGYWARPELSAQRFLPHPFLAGERIYRTGDIVRERSDGVLEFLGRSDFQVKLHGVRIELGEIESRLEKLPAVRQAVVLAREDRPGDRRLVAYVVPDPGERVDWAALRASLRQTLPESMVPSNFVALECLPLTANGKIDRNALPAPLPDADRQPESGEQPRSEIEGAIARVWADALAVPHVGLEENFFDLGATSLTIPEVHLQLQQELGREIPLLDLFHFPTVRLLARRLAPETLSSEPQNRRRGGGGKRLDHPAKRAGIAVVGMAGRFPGAATVERFWENLRDGVESVRTLSEEELLAVGVSPEEFRHPDYVKAAAVLDGVDLFDAAFFGFSPGDAAIMDPQHRHFLECAWEAMEDAGYAPGSFPGPVGVFAGCGTNGYLLHNLVANRRLMESAGLFLIRQTGNDKDVLATRVSYQLNLNGPSMSVQTACSTSLVAVHLACRSLLAGECDMALAGGVTIEVPHAHGYLYREGEILSRDGRCRAFDAAASGTVFSSGAGIVVLRRLDDAIQDRDTIHGIILGSAVNNDGSRKVGFLAPSVEGQAAVIEDALSAAGVSAESISYVEAHGTGTTVGDPIEVKALTQAFRSSTDRKGYCALGSVKTNVGHLDAAAGVAGLIKTLLALRRHTLPPSLHFQSPNPLIDFSTSPFFVNASLRSWSREGGPRRAAVTALGIGGTNAHVVLEEPPPAPEPGESGPWQLLVLSAGTPTALEAMASRLADHLRRHPELRLCDVAFTCQVGRKTFPHRRAIVARDTQEAVQALTGTSFRGVFQGQPMAHAPSPAFLFSGQGAQHVNMAAHLYHAEPVFRRHFDACAEGLLPHLGLNLRDLVYPDADHAAAAADQLTSTEIAQPALFAVEYSLARWWIALGVEPQAMAGHSIGEYVAACLAGVFSLEDALEITAVRGRLMQEMPSGAMLAVPLSEADIPLSGDLAVAAVNAPQQCVVSGPAAEIEAFERMLAGRGVTCRRLRTSHAFHSAMMDPVLERFTGHMRRVALRPPRIPYLSNLTGTWIDEGQATDPAYWARHLRGAVRFSSCLAELLREPGRLLVEVGPGTSLAALAHQHTGHSIRVFPSLPHREDSADPTSFLMGTVGNLWIAGQPIDWTALHAGESVGRASLPAYPFERRRFWIDPDRVVSPPAAAMPAVADHTARSQDRLGGWFYRRVWKSTPPPAPATLKQSCWMVLADGSGLGGQIVAQLRGANLQVIEVTAGNRYRRVKVGEYRIRPGERRDYAALLADVRKHEGLPDKIVHLWSIEDEVSATSVERRLDGSFYSLLFLAQALAEEDLPGADLAVLSDRLYSVAGEATANAVAATLLGPVKVIPKEFPGFLCRNIDIDLSGSGAAQLAVQAIAEHSAAFQDPVVSYRGGVRWTESIEPITLPGRSNHAPLRREGVYLISGGLGDIGLTIAEHLARTVQAKLVLVGRTAIPAESEWERSLESDSTGERTKRAIRKLIEIRSLGGEALPLRADLSAPHEAKRVVEEIRGRFGTVHGVIHAAGAIEDAPLQYKSRTAASRVLAPKVQGTLALDEALRDIPLDFFALFSSVSSLVAPAGQVDYVAANAFLDAFAVGKDHVFAINWGPWSDTRMTARTSSPHPLLERCLLDAGGEVLFESNFRRDRQWLLAEHRFKDGRGVFPGTGYLEMAAAALMPRSFQRGVEFEDVFFTAPLIVGPADVKQVRVHLRPEGDAGFRFSISALDAQWAEKASGRIAPGETAAPARRDLAAIAARCRSGAILFDEEHRTLQENHFAFGSRWKNLKALHLGDREALADLELEEAFVSDLSQYRMHPALLDLATGAALYLIEGYRQSPAVYFPLGYKRAGIYRVLPRTMRSHIRSRVENTVAREVATFDLTIFDGDGRIVAEVEEFSVRRATDPAALLESALTGGAARNTRETLPSPAAAADGRAAGARTQITAREGVEAFSRILSAFREGGPGIVVSPDDPTAAEPNTPARPQAQTTTAISKDDVEAVLTDWWRELLGVTQLGLDDDFFHLGGHSLIVVRLFSKIKKVYGVSFDLSTLFEARTIRELGQLIRRSCRTGQSQSKRSSPLVAIQPLGPRPPLYVISGLAGNILKFHSMAFHLGEDQPVYGLLPRGLDGKEPFHRSVEETAAYYVEAIREFQPEGPYHLVGYSYGGIVAFEAAQQIVGQGGKVGLVGLFDTIEWQYMTQVAGSLSPRKRAEIYRERVVSMLCGEDRVQILRELVSTTFSKIAHRVLGAFGHALPGRVRSIEEANSFAGARYRPKLYSGALTLFRSTKREAVDGDDEYLGWGGLAAQGITVHPIASNHYDILREPGVRVLSERLRRDLDLHLPGPPGESQNATPRLLRMAVEADSPAAVLSP